MYQLIAFKVAKVTCLFNVNWNEGKFFDGFIKILFEFSCLIKKLK